MLSFLKNKNCYLNKINNFIYLFIFFIFLFYSNYLLSIENSKLISLKDIIYIFETTPKKWNQNVIFLKKKKSMEKVIIGYNSTYSLKSNFDIGYVILTPTYEFSKIVQLNLKYNIPNYETKIINKMQLHFDNMNDEFCNSISVQNEIINVTLTKC